MLEVATLQAGYDDLQVLWDVSLVVGEKEFVVLLGPNGAGKTTTLRAISGVIPTMRGEVRFQGERITGLSPDRISQMGLSFITEDLNLFEKMTVEDNLLVGAHAVKDHKQVRRSLDYVTELFPRLKERRGQQAGTLSGGERKMLALGRGLMSAPKLILVDEPSLGLSPILTKSAFSALQELNRSGASILLVEQHCAQALAMTDRGYVLEHGRIALEGSSPELCDNAHVKEIYLG